MGANGKYKEWLTEDGLNTVRGWARDGYSDAQIAKNIGITRTWLYEWKKRFPDFADAIKKGRQPVIVALEDALYRAGIGYDYEEKIEEITDVDGTQRKHIRKITKHKQEDTAALIFALRNLKKWKFKNNPVEEVKEADDVLLAMLRKWDDATNETEESTGEQETD